MKIHSFYSPVIYHMPPWILWEIVQLGFLHQHLGEPNGEPLC